MLIILGKFEDFNPIVAIKLLLLYIKAMKLMWILGGKGMTRLRSAFGCIKLKTKPKPALEYSIEF